jgi:hypothetical protein
MTTTVQLRPIAAADWPRCDLLHGVPLERLAGELGPVALFAPGALVAYRVRSRRRVSLYMFRTLDVADPRAASVPGVRPRVQLLLDLHSAGRVRARPISSLGRLVLACWRGPSPDVCPLTRSRFHFCIANRARQACPVPPQRLWPPEASAAHAVSFKERVTWLASSPPPSMKRST